jgi:hypothetical protein
MNRYTKFLQIFFIYVTESDDDGKEESFDELFDLFWNMRHSVISSEIWIYGLS